MPVPPHLKPCQPCQTCKYFDAPARCKKYNWPVHFDDTCDAYEPIKDMAKDRMKFAHKMGA